MGNEYITMLCFFFFVGWLVGSVYFHVRPAVRFDFAVLRSVTRFRHHGIPSVLLRLYLGLTSNTAPRCRRGRHNPFAALTSGAVVHDLVREDVAVDAEKAFAGGALVAAAFADAVFHAAWWGAPRRFTGGKVFLGGGDG